MLYIPAGVSDPSPPACKYPKNAIYVVKNLHCFMVIIHIRKEEANLGCVLYSIP